MSALGSLVQLPSLAVTLTAYVSPHGSRGRVQLECAVSHVLTSPEEPVAVSRKEVDMIDGDQDTTAPSSSHDRSTTTLRGMQGAGGGARERGGMRRSRGLDHTETGGSH